MSSFFSCGSLPKKKGETLTDALALESLYVGGLPIIQPFLERLRVRAFLDELLGIPDSRLKLPTADSAMLLVRMAYEGDEYDLDEPFLDVDVRCAVLAHRPQLDQVAVRHKLA